MDYYSIATSLLSQGSYAILSFAVGYLLNKERGNKVKREKTECGIRAILKIELGASTSVGRQSTSCPTPMRPVQKKSMPPTTH